MGLPFEDDVMGDVTLSQEGIGAQIFIFEGEGIEQRDNGFDFVGLLEFVAVRGGEGSHFFWV